jgi:hypothetical protein
MNESIPKCYGLWVEAMRIIDRCLACPWVFPCCIVAMKVKGPLLFDTAPSHIEKNDLWEMK